MLVLTFVLIFTLLLLYPTPSSYHSTNDLCFCDPNMLFYLMASVFFALLLPRTRGGHVPVRNVIFTQIALVCVVKTPRDTCVSGICYNCTFLSLCSTVSSVSTFPIEATLHVFEGRRYLPPQPPESNLAWPALPSI